jgi:dynactin complex subunit
MKMSKELFEEIKIQMDLIETEELRQKYREGNFPRADKVKDLNMRYRWDNFNFINQLSNFELSKKAYREENLNDNHVDTALRKIVKPL